MRTEIFFDRCFISIFMYCRGVCRWACRGVGGGVCRCVYMYVVSARGQSELLQGLYKYRYQSNASFVCDEIFTMYRQDNIDYDHF